MEENEMKESLSKDEVWSTLEFAKALYNGFSGYGFFNPFTQEQSLVGLNNDPLIPTYNKILEALEHSPMDAKTLCGYSEFMEVYDEIYGKTLRYLSTLLSFDLNFTCTNMKDPSGYNSDEYKQDLRRVYKFLDAFDYKNAFKNIVVPEVLRKETLYTYFRDSKEIDAPIDIDSEETKIKKQEKFGLQIMPQRYCKLTGYYDCSQLLYDFDMSYFMSGNNDINLFAPSFKKDLLKIAERNKYNPSAQLKDRNGTYAEWVQQSPLSGAFCFKLNINNFRQTPTFASLMKACIRDTDIEQLQYDKDLIGARAIIAGTIRLFDNAKSGTQKNQFSIDPKTLGTLMQLVTNSLKGKIQPISMPTEDNKFFQFSDSNRYMVEDANINSARKGVSASSMIYTNDKMMQFEFQNAIETDYQFMSKIYEQCNAFMNFFVNRKTKKYKFAFEFSGCARSFDREYRRKALNELFSVGLVPNTSYIASVYGMKPQSFDRMLEEAKYGDLQSKLSMLYNKNTMSGVGGNQSIDNDKQVGNPTKDITEISDSGMTSRDYQ